MNRERGTLLAAILGSTIVFLDSTVVNVALQHIGHDLPSANLGALEGESYVYNGYLLSLSALLILAGALADAYGRRRVFAIGLAGFGIASVLCGLAPSIEALVVLRILQGAAGALLVPGSIALLTSTFSGERRGWAFGLWAAASAASSLFGPVVGGLLVETVSWRAVFLINVPLVAVALWATRAYVAESRDTASGHHFDWLGAALAALAVGGLSFGSIYGQEHEWRGPIGPAAVVVGVVALVLFVVLMARGAHPLVPLGLFRSRNFAVTNLSTFLIYGALYVVGYTQAIFTQGTLGYSAIAAGFIGVPGSLLLAVLSSRVGSIAARHGPRRFMAAGPFVMGAGILWFARIPPTSPGWDLRAADTSTYLPPAGYWIDLFPGTILFGLGLALLVAPLTTALMASVPGERAGLASAINNALSRVGPQLAGALVFVAITAAFYGSLAARLPAVDTSSPGVRQAVSPLNAPSRPVSPALRDAAHGASTDAFHLAMLVSAGLVLLGGLANAAGIRDEQVARRHREDGAADEQAVAAG